MSTSILPHLPQSKIPSCHQSFNCNQKKKPLIVTTTKLITLIYTGSWWVCILLLYNFIFLYFTSITPSAQAQVFWECRMRKRLDWEGGGDCSLDASGDAQSSVTPWPRYVTSHSLIHHKSWNITISQQLHGFPSFFLYLRVYLVYRMHKINTV